MTMVNQTDTVERDKFWIERILKSSPDGALFVDRSGRITHVNMVLEELFGWTSEELLGQMVEILLPDRLHQTHPDQVQSYFRDPHPVAIGLRRNLYARHRDGHEIPVEVGLNPIILEDRILVLAIVRNISDRVQLHKRLEMVFDSAPTAMMMVDVDRHIVLINSLIEEMFGYPREELIGATVEQLLPPAFRERHPDLVAGFFDNPAHRKMGVGREVFGRRKNGEDFPCELALSPMPLGAQTFVLASLVDITERKRAEREFRTAREIQKAIMPRSSPQVAGLDIAGMSFPVGATGGDFFDYIQFPTGELAIVIGDVSGHGFGPALLSATCKSYFRALASTRENLAIAVNNTNNLLVDDLPDGQFVTLLAMLLNRQLGTLAYTSAGHQSFLFTRDGTLKLEIQGDGIPLGLIKNQNYRLCEPMPLETGDIIVAVTDGILELSSPKQELFGKHQFFAAVESCCHLPANNIMEFLHQTANQFGEGQPQIDDITMIVIKVQELNGDAGP